MDFQAQYLQAMRERAPKLFRELSKTGELEAHAREMAIEAERMFQELTRNAPKDSQGDPTLQASREAEEVVRATLFEFPTEEMSVEQEELITLTGSRPLLSGGKFGL